MSLYINYSVIIAYFIGLNTYYNHITNISSHYRKEYKIMYKEKSLSLHC